MQRYTVGYLNIHTLPLYPHITIISKHYHYIHTLALELRLRQQSSVGLFRLFRGEITMSMLREIGCLSSLGDISTVSLDDLSLQSLLKECMVKHGAVGFRVE